MKLSKLGEKVGEWFIIILMGIIAIGILGLAVRGVMYVWGGIF